ncbi:hypothetical protein ES703_81291 [subsurface metagenome]
MESGSGVYVTVEFGLIRAEPLGGSLTAATARESSSMSLSLARTEIVTAVSSGVVAESSVATGGSFTGVTVIVTVAVAVPPLPSLIV